MGAPRKFKGDVRRQIAEAYASDEPLLSMVHRFGADMRTIRRILSEFPGIPSKRSRSKRQQIIHISLTEPNVGPTAISRRIGATLNYVLDVRRECNLRLPKTPNVDPAKDRADMRAVQEVRP